MRKQCPQLKVSKDNYLYCINICWLATLPTITGKIKPSEDKYKFIQGITSPPFGTSSQEYYFQTTCNFKKRRNSIHH